MALPIVFMAAFFEQGGRHPLMKKGEVVEAKYIITALFKSRVRAF